MAFINHGLITRFLDLLLQSIICSSWHFPFRVATTRITPSSSFQGLGQKTKQDLLKEESEKMKVFAQQLRSKPQFIAVFKVCNIISSDNRQQLKSKPSVHCCLQGGPMSEFQHLSHFFPGLFQLPLADLHDCCVDHGGRDGAHLHLPLLALAGWENLVRWFPHSPKWVGEPD